MKYQVDVFVLGCDPELTKDQFEVEAKNQDEAETLAISGGLRAGYGENSSYTSCFCSAVRPSHHLSVASR